LTRATDASGQSVLGTYIADAQRAAAKAEVGLMNTGGIRADIDHDGPVTWGEVFRVHPFGNKVVSMQLTGAQLIAALEQQFPATGPANVLHLSGMTVTLDLTRPPGSRVKQVVLDGGRALEPGRSYSVAVNSFLADGGDGFPAFKKGRKRRTVAVDVDVLEKHLRSGAAVPAKPPRRVVIAAGTLDARTA
jgi:2',3'-cyclic-nucleotide 2'-phosphodiesterase (5'-nucleotidase family)